MQQSFRCDGIIRRPAQYLKGVGPARAAQLGRLGIQTVEDLLWTPPRRYEDRSRLMSIRELRVGEPATVRARLLAKSLHRARRGQLLFHAAFGDATGVVYGLWFNQPFLQQQLRVNDEFILHGRLEPGKRLQLIHPELERIEPDIDETTIHTGRIVPVYALTGALTQRWMRQVVWAALAQVTDDVEESLPETLRHAEDLPELAWVLQQIHFPQTMEAIESARRRLVFEELLVMQIRLGQRRARLAARIKPQRYAAEGPLISGFFSRLPFVLTESQRRAFDELRADLCRPAPMLRLLQGDVGCGKTIVAAALMAVVLQSGYQVAVMAPTELLAQQHLRLLRRQMEPLGVRVELLAQGVRPQARRRLLADIARGAVGIVVGTHALLQPTVSFARLGLAVIDEQHKFGVVQRAALARKGQVPDVLVMTATPIPRTLALSIYGDLACSTIDELPPGRAPVQTIRLREAQRAQAYRYLEAALRQGRQGYVVYPLVDEDDRTALRAASHMAAQLQAEAFAASRVGLLHGQMRAGQQEAVMRDFADGAIHLLVSTVIVEVGLDVPNATVMLIEHAERFGLAQLHQLRGRIGRSAHPGLCLLMSDTEDELANQRLSALVETTDGFRLAERDLALRGAGELLGRRQHGWLRFRVADLVKDQASLQAARDAAETLLAQDPQLSHPAHRLLAQRLRQWSVRAG